MGRNPPRACGVKARQAIKENAVPHRAKVPGPGGVIAARI